MKSRNKLSIKIMEKKKTRVIMIKRFMILAIILKIFRHLSQSFCLTLIKIQKQLQQFFFSKRTISMENSLIQLQKHLEKTGIDLQSGNEIHQQSLLGSEKNEEIFYDNSAKEELPRDQFYLNSEDSRQENVHLPIPIYEEDESANLFLQTNLRNESSMLQHEIFRVQLPKERKKNGNVPKFICRTTFYRFSKHKKIFKNYPKLQKEMTNKTYQERKKYIGNKNANNTLKDVEKFFINCCFSSNPKLCSFLMRKMLHNILRTSLKEQVINNYQIQLKKEYMISLKMQALRCKNRTLMCRVESK